MPDGEWTALEVKLGVNQEEAAAKHLLYIQRRIAETGGQPPQSLAIIVGLSSAAYRRPDGVYVLPITALKPLYRRMGFGKESSEVGKIEWDADGLMG